MTTHAMIRNNVHDLRKPGAIKMQSLACSCRHPGIYKGHLRYPGVSNAAFREPGGSTDTVSPTTISFSMLLQCHTVPQGSLA